MAPRTSLADLVAAYPAEVADPKHLLEGSGKVHRHVALRRVADLDRAGVKALLRAAHGAWRQRGKEKA